MRTAPLPQHSPRHGFSLTEMAVVLGVIAAILASIFTFVPQVMQRKHASEIIEDMTIVINNLRNSYNGVAGLPRLGTPAMMSALIRSKTVPVFMVRNPATGCSNPNAACADGPWGVDNPDSPGNNDPIGTFRVCDWDTTMTACSNTAGGGNGAASQYFGIYLRGLSKGDCVRVAMQGTLPSGPTGLLDLRINGTSVRGLGHGFPVLSTDASAYCSLTGIQNALLFTYRLRNGAL